MTAISLRYLSNGDTRTPKPRVMAIPALYGGDRPSERREVPAWDHRHIIPRAWRRAIRWSSETAPGPRAAMNSSTAAQTPWVGQASG
jgi:hypothetical protein